MTRLSAALLALPAFALAEAQYQNGASSKTTAKAMTTPTASSSSSGAIHSISVGQGGQLKFVPDSITAKVGDQVEFSFMAAGHSVAEGDFSNPCQPMSSSAFFSGWPVSTGSKPFTITVNSTDPMWFYCTAPAHCQSGMVGVINAPSGMTVAQYAAAAMKTSKSSAPAHVQGGVFAVAKAPSGTSGGASTTMMASASSSSAAAATGAAAGQLLLGSIGASLPLGILGYLFL